MVNRVRKQVSRSVGSSRPVEIVIKAQDQASRTFIQIKNDMNVLGTAVDSVRQSVVMLGNAISNVSASTVDSIAEVYRQAMNLKNFLSNDFAVAGISLVVGQLESLTKGSMNFGSTFSSVMELAVGPGKAQKIGSTFGKVMGEQAFSSFVGSVNLIDQKIMQLWGSVNSIGSKITPGADVLLGASKGLLGVSEPLEIFRGMQEGVRKFSGGLVGVIQEIGQLQMGLGALQQLANFGPFNALIQQNIKFREQLVSTQTSLAATNSVMLGGVEISNTANAIKALEGPVRASIQKMRRDSLELVGVTSSELVGVYDILSSQVSKLGGGLNDASNLTIDFAAALGTIGVPIHQARQEITSILNAQVDQNSALAKSIGLTNQQLLSWKSQGVMIERIRERLEAFAEGNKMAAMSVGGISSNIQEVFENIMMAAGEPLLDPLIEKLAAVYEYLNKNALDIQFFITDISMALLEVGEAVSRMVAKLAGPLAGVGKELIEILVNAVTKMVRIFEEVFNVVLPALEPIINFITFVASHAESITTPFFKLFLAAGSIKVAMTTLGPALKTVLNLFPGMGEAMAIVEGRGNSLVNQFANLAQSVGSFKAAGLLALKNVESIPGAMDNIAKAMGPLGGFAPMLAPIIPMVGTAGIAFVGLTKQFPMLKNGIQGVLTSVPGLLDGLASTAHSSNFLNGALKGFAPALQGAADGSIKYADANTLAAMANEKLTKIAKETTIGLAKQVAQMALYSGAIFALFFAFDNLILKNEGMMALIGEIGEQLSDLGNMIMDFLRNPVVSAIIALGALATLIATGVIPNMIKMGITSVNAFKAEAVKNLGDFKKILMGLGDTVVQMIAKYTGLAGATTASAGADAKKVTIGSILGAQQQKLLVLYEAEKAQIAKAAAVKSFYAASTKATIPLVAGLNANISAAAAAAALSISADEKKIVTEGIAAKQKARFLALYAVERNSLIAAAAAKKAEALAAAQNAAANSAMTSAGRKAIPMANGLTAGMTAAATAATKSAAATTGLAITTNTATTSTVGLVVATNTSTVSTNLSFGAMIKLAGATAMAGAAAVGTAIKTKALAIANKAATLAASANQILKWVRALDMVSVRAAISAAATMLFGNTLKFTALAANAQAIMKWAFAAEFATSRTAAFGVANKILIGGLKGAALAAKGLITALGPMALAVVAIAAAAEAVRILHQEFFAGNKILKEYLESIEEAQTKLENTRYQGRGNAEPERETYWQNRLDIAQDNRGNFATSAFRAANANASFNAYARGAGITSREEVNSLREKGMTTFEGALQALADNEAGRIQLSEKEKEFAESFVDSMDRHVDRITADTGETLTEVDQLIRDEEARIPKLQGEMDRLVQDYNAGNITDDQFEAERTKINEEMTNAIDYMTQMRDRLLALENPDANQKRQIAELTAAIDSTSEAYGNIDSAAIEQKDVSRVGSQQEQLSGRASQAEAFIVGGKGDPAEYAEQAKRLIESTNQMLEAGMISEEEALRRLNLVATNTKLDGALIAQAQESMTKAVEGQSQRRVQTLQAEQSTVQTQMRQGTLTQVEGAEKLKTLTEQEGQEKLNALDDQYENTTNARNAEEQDALTEQQGVVDALREKLAEAGPDTVTGKQLAEELATAEAAMATTRQSYANQALVAEQTYNNERVRIANETAENVIAAEERVHEAKVRNLEEAQQDAQNTSKTTSLTSSIAQQTRLNTVGGMTQEELINWRAGQGQQTIRDDLKAEQDKLEGLEKLGPLTDPDKERERQQQIQASRIRTHELTLQLMQSELSEAEQVHAGKVKLLEQAQQDAQNTAKEVQTETDILNQQLLNSGSITEQQLAARQAESGQDTLRADLASEQEKLAGLEAQGPLSDPEKERERQQQIRQARMRTQDLTLQLLKSEREEIETNIALLETELQDAARGVSNELEGQVKTLERQQKLNENLNRAFENRKKLAEATNSLAKAGSDYVTSEFELLAQTTNSEYRKKQIAQATAAIKLESAKMAAAFAERSLEMEYEQNKLARERELMENRMAILRAEQAVAQGDVNLRVADERLAAGLITQSERDAIALEQQGNIMQLDFAQQERGLIMEQQANDDRIFAMRAQQTRMEGQSSIRQAEIGLANALPPGLRERVLNQIGDEIAQDAGYGSRSDMINSGMALGRDTAQERFGVGRSVGALSAFDSSLEGLRETLTPQQYAAAVADSQRQFGRQMGSSAFSMQQNQLLGRGATAFNLEGQVERITGSTARDAGQFPDRTTGMGIRDIAPTADSRQIAEGIGMGIASAMNRDVAALPSATTAGMGAREADRMIAALEGGGRGEVQFNPVIQIEVNASTEEAGTAIAEQVHRELEKVIEKSRELLRAA